MAGAYSASKLVAGIEVTKSDFIDTRGEVQIKGCCSEFVGNSNWDYCPVCGEGLNHYSGPVLSFLLKEDFEVPECYDFWNQVGLNIKSEYRCSIHKLDYGSGKHIIGYYIEENNTGMFPWESSSMSFRAVAKSEVTDAFRKFNEDIQLHVPRRTPKLYIVSVIKREYE